MSSDAAPPAAIIAFKGATAVRQRPDSALPFVLVGESRDARGETLLLALTRVPVPPPSDLLTELTVELSAGGRYTLRAAEGVFQIDGARHFLHHDVGPAFYRVLPPFEVPWLKRALWRAILIAARLKL